MPWQVAAADVMYELDSNGSLFYREARITVPRQSGKTTFTLARHVHRCLYSEELGWGTRPVTAYTAQTATDAREKMTLEWMPLIEDSPIYGDVSKMSLSNGKENITFVTGGRIKIFPPTQSGGHGSTLDLVDLDECFAHVDGRAEQGARPAMITRASPQICIQSTAGTLESLYLREKVDDGRARVEAGDCGHVFYLEYSAGPDNDVHDESQWHLWMPALGFTQSIEALRGEHESMGEDAWARAFGNQWTGSTVQIIPATAWAAAYSPKAKREGRAWMALDVSPGLSGQGRSASISIAYYVGSQIHVAVIAHAPGTSWVPEMVGELTRTHVVEALYVDATGPAGAILPDVKAKSAANVEVIDAQAMVNSCARFHQAVLDGAVRHRDQEPLNDAVKGAARRTLNDGWALKRVSSSTDISPLVSAVLAHWGAVLQPETGPITMFVNGA